MSTWLQYKQESDGIPNKTLLEDVWGSNRTRLPRRSLSSNRPYSLSVRKV